MVLRVVRKCLPIDERFACKNQSKDQLAENHVLCKAQPKIYAKPTLHFTLSHGPNRDGSQQPTKYFTSLDVSFNKTWIEFKRHCSSHLSREKKKKKRQT